MSKVREPQGNGGANRKEGSKSRASTATADARPVKKGIPGTHASPEAGTRPLAGKTNLPEESRRDGRKPQAVDIREKS